MKKIISVCLCFVKAMNKLMSNLLIIVTIIIITSPYARCITFSPWIGYANVSMKEFDEELEFQKQMAEKSHYENIMLTKFSDSYINANIVGVDIGIFRISQLVTNPVRFRHESTIDTFQLIEDTTYEPFFASIMLRSSISTTKSFNFYLYGGFGGYVISSKRYILIDDWDTTSTNTYIGMGFVGEIVTRIQLGSLGIDFSYKYAPIHDESDGPMSLKYLDYLTVDFSGLTVCLSYNFGSSSVKKKDKVEPVPYFINK